MLQVTNWRGKVSRYNYFLQITYHVQCLAPYFYPVNPHHNAIAFIALISQKSSGSDNSISELIINYYRST